GFDIHVCVEIDEECRETIRRNRPTWRLTQSGDVFALSPEDILREAGLERGEAFIVSGGPPCQPFSKAGFWVNGDSARLSDPRSRTLNAFLSVVEAALPQVVLFENVAGMAYRGKDEGIRLLRDGIHEINSRNGTRYSFVEFRLN